MEPQYHITQLNEHAVLISLGNVIDREINKKIISLHDQLRLNPFDGFIESVPAYSSLAVYHCSRFSVVKNELDKTMEKLHSGKAHKSKLLHVPVLYDGEDLAYVAQHHRLRLEDVATLHCSLIYQVFMIGFLPGFPYLGKVDDRIATPRKDTPRSKVPAGSVGIAGFQTGIYPQSSPGGWQLIGRTPLKIFNTSKEQPCLFSAGDEVKFFQVSKSEFDSLNEY